MVDSRAPLATIASDIRPVVATRASNRAVWIFAAIVLAAASGAFYALQLRRITLTKPMLVASQPDTSEVIADPPQLAIAPEQVMAQDQAVAHSADAQPLTNEIPEGHRVQSILRGALVPWPADELKAAPASDLPPTLLSGSQPMPAAGPNVVSTISNSDERFSTTPIDGKEAVDARAKASRLINPATTVPQGTVIQAILETALNSTQSGFARAIVSRDVFSFDGTHVLIAKGSRLFGEYAANASLGQNRALIQWHRLTRPDGSIIDVDSPSADPLGRAGVKARVNSHFLERFGGAILQSALDIGVGVATRKAVGDTVFVALPNSTASITPPQPTNIRPTLNVRQGASVSVFVARDLDFTDIEP